MHEKIMGKFNFDLPLQKNLNLLALSEIDLLTYIPKNFRDISKPTMRHIAPGFDRYVQEHYSFISSISFILFSLCLLAKLLLDYSIC